MSLRDAVKAAKQWARNHGRAYFVYRDEDGYHICSESYHHSGEGEAFISEASVVFHTSEGFYHD